MIVTALAYAMFGMTIASPMTELDSRQAKDPNDTDVRYQPPKFLYILSNFEWLADLEILSVMETMTAATHPKPLASASWEHFQATCTAACTSFVPRTTTFLELNAYVMIQNFNSLKTEFPLTWKIQNADCCTISTGKGRGCPGK